MEKAQEFPALFLVNERKKMQREYGSNHGGLIPGFLYRISTAECLHHGVKPLGQPFWHLFTQQLSATDKEKSNEME